MQIVLNRGDLKNILDQYFQAIFPESMHIDVTEVEFSNVRNDESGMVTVSLSNDSTIVTAAENMRVVKAAPKLPTMEEPDKPAKAAKPEPEVEEESEEEEQAAPEQTPEPAKPVAKAKPKAAPKKEPKVVNPDKLFEDEDDDGNILDTDENPIDTSDDEDDDGPLSFN